MSAFGLRRAQLSPPMAGVFSFAIPIRSGAKAHWTASRSSSSSTLWKPPAASMNRPNTPPQGHCARKRQKRISCLSKGSDQSDGRGGLSA